MKRSKKLLACLLVLTCLLPASGALAITQEEWNLSCNSKTSRSVDAYQYPGPDDRGKFIATLPANTYVHKDDSTDGWTGVTWMINGVKGYGWVEEALLVRCSSQIRGSDGFAHNIHELDPRHDRKVSQNLVILIAPSLLAEGKTDYSGVEFELPDSPAARAVRESAQAGSQETVSDAAATTPEKTQADAAPVATASTPLKPAPKREPKETRQAATTQDGVSVTIKTLGSAISTVSYNGGTYEVLTADLSFGQDVPEDKKLAVIHTPRTGKASLRKSASGDANLLKQCKAGTLVGVLEYGKTYTKINYKNAVGYILTDCLKFHGIAGESVDTGKLIYNGKATGGTTINIRLEADGGSRTIGEFKTGTEVLVIQRGGEWCEIEVNGIRGFVMAKYLMATE